MNRRDFLKSTLGVAAAVVAIPVAAAGAIAATRSGGLSTKSYGTSPGVQVKCDAVLLRDMEMAAQLVANPPIVVDDDGTMRYMDPWPRTRSIAEYYEAQRRLPNLLRLPGGACRRSSSFAVPWVKANQGKLR